ncbi:hypothetical protein BJF92_00650 [Rhizobium rhizosphaerae]|uniref:Uncharacterized protein n=1 Tax=Xaviernesmea rhizosphaerae TaxID=1672749 RepID=A0A1Q9AEC3_9HYPH|nr:hypothetical protein [Xaviernesmea rhizosphaerae]OLP53310.1 hypothetical protein BJF92_00650 [Xaviernesmea rhizosphaerae]
MQYSTTNIFTADEAIAFVIENAQKPHTDKTRVSQAALKRMHPLVRRANILWKRVETNHRSRQATIPFWEERTTTPFQISGPHRDEHRRSGAAEAKERRKDS